MADKTLNKIFLSASIPLPERDKIYYDTADIMAIRDSVSALASVVIPHAHLVWGGHPSINPLIRYVLDRMSTNVKDHVTLYLSNFFEKVFPPDVFAFENVILANESYDAKSSLLIMRQMMFAQNDFKAAVFIGGMEGIEEEYDLFKAYHPNALTLPVASTGAAARILYDRLNNLNRRLLDDYAYMALFRELLAEYI